MNLNRITLFSIVFCFLIFGCQEDQTSDIATTNALPTEDIFSNLITITEAQFQRGRMKVGTIQNHRFSERIRATGIIDVPVDKHIRLSTYTGGYVKHMNLIPGNRVKKGQVLFQLENPEFIKMQQDYLEAKARLTYLESDYQRQQTLAGENIASQKNYLKAEAEFLATQSKMVGLEKRMDLIGLATNKLSIDNMVSKVSILAPISGYITEVHAAEGMFLESTNIAVELVNTDHLHLELKVFEKDVFNVKIGQPIQFSVLDANQAALEGEVYIIGKVVEGDARVVHIHGHIHQEEKVKHFVPGMFVEAAIITESIDAKALPESAIVESEGQAYVLIEVDRSNDGYQFEKIPVQIGKSEQGLVQILNESDIDSTKSVLLEGGFNLIQD